MKYSKKIPILFLLTCFILACDPPTSVKENTDDTDINGYADETFFKVDGKEILNRGYRKKVNPMNHFDI